MLLQLPFCAAAAKDGASSRRFACFASISFMPLMQPFHIFLELLLVRLVLVPAALATSAGVHARSLSRLDGRRGGCRADIGKQR